MFISFDTEKLTEDDRRVLRAMAGGGSEKAVSVDWPEPEPKPKPEPVKVDPVVPDTDGTDPAPESAVDEPTLQDAVNLASELVSKGRASEVKAALNKLGVAKVSKLEGPSAIAEFIAELS
jgi:hypothetical protein